jgi:hypothetical protein
MERFTPPFCPYPSCDNHLPNPLDDWPGRVHVRRYGRHPSGLARFRCVSCKATFCEGQFDCEFRHRRVGLGPLIFELFTGGFSNRQIARALSCSEWLVRSRLSKLSKQGMLYHAQLTANLKIAEPVAYDGLENFARSQYEPNNINHAIGQQSLFIYDFNFAPIRRKGRMSDRQKLNKEKLDQLLGKIPKMAIKDSSQRMFEQLAERLSDSAQKLTLLSDEHYLYKRALEALGPNRQLIDHQTVSSKAPRTYKNILFAVNHADLLTRQHVKAFARETISFAKTAASMVQKYALFMVWKNYFRPQFTKRHKLDPSANTHSPAQKLGLVSHRLKYSEVFKHKLFKNHTKLSHDWSLFIDNQTPYQRSQVQLLTAHN